MGLTGDLFSYVDLYILPKFSKMALYNMHNKNQVHLFIEEAMHTLQVNKILCETGK